VEPDSDAVAAVARLAANAAKPVLVVGGDVYWAGAEAAMCAAAEAARIPVFVNGLGRGTLPADHELAFSRARSVALKGADLVIVAGTPLDFRLGFGRFGDARVVHLADTPDNVSTNVALAGAAAGDLERVFALLAEVRDPITNLGSRACATRKTRDGRRSATGSRPTRAPSIRPGSTAS
jgi:acetolactate synthase-1/2/3 large subunit